MLDAHRPVVQLGDEVNDFDGKWCVELVCAEFKDREHSRNASGSHHVGVHVRALPQGGSDLFQVVDHGQGPHPPHRSLGVI